MLSLPFWDFSWQFHQTTSSTLLRVFVLHRHPEKCGSSYRQKNGIAGALLA